MSFELEAASHSQNSENDSWSCMLINSNSSSELSSFQLSLLLVKNFSCQKYSAGLTLTLILAYLFIFVFGLIGNSLVIFVVSWRPRMRTVTNIFILNLAVADLFVILFCVPPTLLANIYIPWVMGEFMCKAVTYVQGVSVFSSVYSLVAVSLDRCQAIHRPMGYPRGLSKSQCALLILLIWLVALLTTLPWLFTFQITLFPETGLLPYCHETWNNKVLEKIYYIVVHVLICYIVPLILIIIFNSIIWQSVVDRQNPQSHNTTANTNVHQMHRVTRLRVFKMLASLTLAFFLCWLPLYVIMTRIKFFGDLNQAPEWEQELIHILVPISQLLGSCNSCVNPVLYAWLNKKFRETLKSLLPSFPFNWCCKRSAFSSSMAAEGSMEQNMDLSLSVLNSRYTNTAMLNVPTVSPSNLSPNSLYATTSVTTL